MLEYLTPQHLIAFFTFLLALDKLAHRIAPLTATTKDDEILAKIDKAKDWIGTYAPIVFAIVEDLGATGKIQYAQKAAEFLNRLKVEWFQAHPGEELPKEAEAQARLIAAGLAASLPHSNPQPGPAPK